MKNLGRTIEKILRVDPALEEKLLQIKSKWKKAPSKTMTYWKELLHFLNSDSLLTHPKRNEIKEILTERRKSVAHLYTFDLVTPNDRIIGVIPENVADKIRRYDVKAIQLAKLQVEASMTRNVELMARISRDETLMEINIRKIWLAMKDYFHLWDKTIKYTIKKNQDMLVLTEQPNNPQSPMPGGSILRVDQSNLRQFLKFLGLENPEE